MVHCIPNIFLLLVLIHSFCCATTTLQQQIRTAFKQNQYSQVVQLLSEWNLKTPHAEPSKKEILTQFELLELLSQSYDFLHNDDKAIETYERLLTLQAKYKTPQRSLLALNGLGLILSSRGQGARAIDLMHEATKVASKNPAVWNNYATTQHKHGALQEAVRSYKKAFVLSKFKVKVYGYNFANALMDVTQYKKAISTLQTVIKLDNTFAEAHWKLGRCFASSQVNTFKKAVRSFRAALRHVQHAVKFTKADVLFELHDAYLGLPQPKHNKAIQSLEQAVALAPNNAEYIFALEHLYRYTVHFSGLQSIQFKSSALLHKELEQPEQHKRSNLSPMRALTFLKPDQMIKLMKGWSASMLSFPKVTATANRVKTSSTPVLRIGFLSSEWETNSPTMHIMDRLPTLLKTSSVHVYALKNSPVIYPDSTPLSSMENVVVRRFEGLTDQKIAQLITNDALDFLIDLNGYTAGGQPEVLGMLDTSENPNNKNKRGNKVSTVSYLGWPSTFGHSNLVQYAVVDRYVVTIETSALHFTERLFILPHSFFVGDHDYKMKKYMMQIKNHDLSALRMYHRQALFGKNHHQQFVFCNFNQLFKLSIDESDTLQVWSQILRRTPFSLLWLLRHPSVAEPSVRLHLLANGISNHSPRILFSDFVDKQTYLQRSSAADLFLDNARYNAGATGVDSLYSQVPILTLPTQRIVGRMVSTQLHAMNMTTTITHSVKAYEDAAVLVGKRKRLVRGLKRKLKDRTKGNLFDFNAFAKKFQSMLKISKEMKSSGGVKHVVMSQQAEGSGGV